MANLNIFVKFIIAIIILNGLCDAMTIGLPHLNDHRYKSERSILTIFDKFNNKIFLLMKETFLILKY